MKITQVVESVGRGFPFSRIAYHLANEFSKKGIKSMLVTGKVLDQLDPNVEVRLVATKLEAIRLKFWNKYTISKLINMFVVPLIYRYLTKYANKHKSELGTVINHIYFGGDINTIYSCMYTYVKTRSETGERKFLFYPLNIYRLLIERKKYSKKIFKRGIAGSQRTKKQIVDTYKVSIDDISVIPLGVDCEEFNPKKSEIFKKSIREKYDVPSNALLLLFVGANFWAKGLKYILESLVIKKQAWLLVVGSGLNSYFKALSNNLGVGNRVIFAGCVNDVSQYYAASDIFVFPSVYESFPMVCLEAMASGLPVLSTEVGGVEDYLVAGYNGFFIDRYANDIATKVSILSDVALRKKIGENARKTAKEFDWGKIAERYINVCK